MDWKGNFQAHDRKIIFDPFADNPVEKIDRDAEPDPLRKEKLLSDASLYVLSM